MEYTSKDGFPYYFNLVKVTDCLQLFYSQETFKFLLSINEEKAAYRYAQGKWNIKQIVGHLADHERIKMYRAFLLSRNEAVQLWGYNQDLLVARSRFEELTLEQLIVDLQNLRKSSISFLEGLSSYQLSIKGWAKEYEVTLEAFLKTIVGHEIHHINVIKEKYL